jgi:antitoxin (DNA-binding transcriptional repressor) of toxin-antitoxin stability system
MKTISMLELRSKGRDIVKRLDRGERLELTYRGRKVAVMEPAVSKKSTPIPADDPIFAFLERAEPLGGLTNEDIDQVLYGWQADPR